jgi:Trypsin-like peptidase domain
MNRLTFRSAWALLLAGALSGATGLRQAHAATPNELARAVVRLPSHGASATVISTADGQSWLLTCAHAFQGADRHKRIVVDAPARAPLAWPKGVGIQLLDADYDSDLALLLLHDGPLDFAAAVAPQGHVPGRRLLSVGYDEMRVPARERPATILVNTGSITFTRERPWHGRSGGALLDLDSGYLIGVVSGYEVTGQRRGIYVAHAAILRFLDRWQRGIAPLAGDTLREHQPLSGGFSTPLPFCLPGSRS